MNEAAFIVLGIPVLWVDLPMAILPVIGFFLGFYLGDATKVHK